MLWRGWTMEKILLFFAGYLEGGSARPRSSATCRSASRSPPSCRTPSAWPARRSSAGDDAWWWPTSATAPPPRATSTRRATSPASQVPMVFVCQNNHWAISVPRAKQTRRALRGEALAYGFPGVRVDGNDLLAVYQATPGGGGTGRRGEGPTLIEASPTGSASTPPPTTRPGVAARRRGAGVETKEFPLHPLRGANSRSRCSSRPASRRPWSAEIARAVTAFEAIGAAAPLRHVRPRLRHADRPARGAAGRGCRRASPRRPMRGAGAATPAHARPPASVLRYIT